MSVPTRVSQRRRWAAAIIAVSAIALAAYHTWAYFQARSYLGRTFRVGFHESPPYLHADSAKGPKGPAFELVEEAGRRAGVKLQWVHAPEGPYAALSGGRADLWPMLATRTGHDDRLQTTSPWNLSRFFLVTRSSSNIQSPRDMVGRKLGHPVEATTNYVARTFFPGAVLVPLRLGTLAALCGGEIDSVLFQEDRAVPSSITLPAACAKVPVRFVPVSEATLGYGIGAWQPTPGAAAAAHAIRREIGEMAFDGTLSAIYFRWFGKAGADTMVIDERLDAQREGRWVVALAVFLGLAAIALTWLALRFRAARRGAELARQAATRSSEAKSEFLSQFSHEIRTPLNGIIGLTSLLEQTQLTGEQRELAKGIHQSGEILLGLINDILDFSKIEAEKMELERVVFQLPELLEDVAELLALQAQTKRLELCCEITPNVPSHVAGDPVRLRQVLLNLGANAIKFTDRGEVLLRCQAYRFEHGIVWLRLEIEDTGIGVPGHLMPVLFQPFQQADASTTRRHGGTGLGLAIARRLVEKMNGTIGYTPGASGGSIFWFRVPFYLAPKPEETSGRILVGRKICVASEHAATRAVIAQQIRALGGEADSYATLADVLAAGRYGTSYFALLLDLGLGGSDDLAPARALRSNPDFSTVPIIALVPHSLRLSQEQIESEMLAGVLPKPVRQARLRQCLSALAPGRPASAPPEARHDLPPPPMPEGPRVLLVEDNIINRKAAESMLRKLGCRVEVAPNGAAAVENAVRSTFDLILMDCLMPEMDGFEATQRIREAERGGRRAVIVAVTANAFSADREKCLAAGMDDYVAKPVDLDTLSALLQRWLPSRELASSPARLDVPAS